MWTLTRALHVLKVEFFFKSHHAFDRRTYLLGIFCLLFALGTTRGVSGDAARRLVITQQILAYGRVHVPDPQEGLVQTPDGWTVPSPIGQVLLFIPFEAAGKILSFSGVPGARAIPLTYFYCPVVGAAFCLALLAMLEAFGLSSAEAAAASLILTFCSLALFYVAHSYQEEIPAAVLVCLSLRAVLLWRRLRRRRYAFQSGLFGASILLFRYNGVFALIPLAVVFAGGLQKIGLKAIRAPVTAGLLGTLGPASVYATFAYLRFGNPLLTGYEGLHPDWEAQVPPDAGLAFYFSTGMNLLFGIGKGLFIFSPVFIVALWALWTRRSTLARYGIGCLAALLGGILLALRILPAAVDGCWSWGPRYQVHLLPLLAYPAWIGVKDLVARRLQIVVIATLGFGFFAHLCGMAAFQTLEYRQLLPQSDPVGVCRAVQTNQFAMRLRNISRALGFAEDPKTTDETLRREFNPFWGFRNARRFSGWIRDCMTLAWLGFFVLAPICLHSAFAPRPPYLGRRSRTCSLLGRTGV